MSSNLIYKSNNFDVVAAKNPHVDREDGGHIVILPHRKMADRQELTSREAIELMRLTIIVGKAMKKIMNAHGVDIGRINYQDNGNWSVFKANGPYLHIHLYGRAKSAKIQPYGQSLHFPHIGECPEFYANMQPLNEEDIRDIKSAIISTLNEDEFSGQNWGEL